jgi:hypothetical protein
VATTTLPGVLRAVTAVFCLAFSGCQHMAPEPDSSAPAGTRKAAELRGRVSSKAPTAAPIVVVAFERGADRITHRAFLADDSAFALPLAAGRYKVYAFADQDGDGRLDAGEPRSVVYALASTLHAGERRELPMLRVR